MVDAFWTARFHSAAAQLSESYNLDRSVIMQTRSLGAPLPTDTNLNYDIRRKAQSLLQTLPQGRELADEAEKLRQAFDSLRAVYDESDEVWDLALREQRAAIDTFQAAVAAIIERDS